MTDIIINGAPVALPPTTLGRLEAIQNAVLGAGEKGAVAKYAEVVNAAFPPPGPIGEHTQVTMTELKNAFPIIMRHAGFEVPEPGKNPAAD